MLSRLGEWISNIPCDGFGDFFILLVLFLGICLALIGLGAYLVFLKIWSDWK